MNADKQIILLDFEVVSFDRIKFSQAIILKIQYHNFFVMSQKYFSWFIIK